MAARPKRIGNKISRLLRWFYQRLYSELAWGYDPFSRLASGGLWREWTFAAERFLPARPVPEPILDLGCGTGHFVIRLTRRGHRIYGTDRSWQMLKAAGKRFGQAGLNIRLVQGSAQALPFPDSSLCAVITTFPATYVYDPATRQEIVRVLRPGGRWIWVDAPFSDPPTLRMRIWAVVSTLAQLKGSVSLCEKGAFRCRLRKMAGFSEETFEWNPQIDHEPEFFLRVHRVAVKSTFVHAAIMDKKIL